MLCQYIIEASKIGKLTNALMMKVLNPNRLRVKLKNQMKNTYRAKTTTWTLNCFYNSLIKSLKKTKLQLPATRKWTVELYPFSV